MSSLVHVMASYLTADKPLPQLMNDIALVQLILHTNFTNKNIYKARASIKKHGVAGGHHDRERFLDYWPFVWGPVASGFP